MKKSIIIILFVCFACTVHSQNMQIHRVQLPDAANFASDVNCIFQDKFGFMWFGKETGLERFDGVERKIYRNLPSDPKSIGANVISAIAEDTAGNLWVCTKGGGLNYFDQKKEIFTRYTHLKTDSTSIISNELACICPDGKGNFWIGTDGNGLVHFNPRTKTFTNPKPHSDAQKRLRSKRVSKIVPAANGKYWIGTIGGGLHLFSPAKQEFERCGDNSLFSAASVQAIKEVKPGILWIAASYSGLLEYNIATKQFKDITPDKKLVNFRSIRQLPSGEIFVATYSGLVYFKDTQSPYQLIEWFTPGYTSFAEIYVDRTNSIWLGSADGIVGLIKSTRKNFRAFPATSPLHLMSAYYIYHTGKNNRFVINKSNGTVLVNPQSGQYKIFSHTGLQGFSPATLGNLPNSLLVKLPGGLMELNVDNETLVPPKFSGKNHEQLLRSAHIIDDFSDSTGAWLKDKNFIYKVAKNAATGSWDILQTIDFKANQEVPFSHNRTGILEQANGDLWLGTWGSGLCMRKKGQNTFTVFKNEPGNPTSISSNFVVCLATDKQGNVLIGTQAGLNRYDISKGTFANISMANGLADDYISAIAVDSKNKIWVSTHKGISSVSANFKTIRNFDENDGLRPNVFLARSTATDLQGNIYFGGRRGLVWFHPDSIFENPYVPQIAVTALDVNGKRITKSDSAILPQNIQFTQHIQLSNHQNSLTFRLAALSYFNANANKLKYKLLGYDRDWRLADADRTAKYFDLPWGTYTFTVMAANDDGLWNPTPKNIQVTIAAPFWLSPWAIILYVLGISGAWAFYWFRQKKVPQPELVDTNNKQLAVTENRQPAMEDNDPVRAEFLQKVTAIVEENLQNPDFDVEQLCEILHTSRPNLYRKFNSHIGMPVSEFIRDIRLTYAAKLLLEKKANISEVGYMVGFKETRFFRKHFRHKFGVTPSAFITQNDTKMYHD